MYLVYRYKCSKSINTYNRIIHTLCVLPNKTLEILAYPGQLLRPLSVNHVDMQPAQNICVDSECRKLVWVC